MNSLRGPLDSVRRLLTLGVALAVFGCNGESHSPSHTDKSGAKSNPGHRTPSKTGSGRKQPDLKTALAFSEVAAPEGVRFTYRNGIEAGHYSILEELGGGVALFDFDRDGLIDLFFPGGGHFGPDKQILGHPPALFRNLGNWRFEEVTQSAGLNVAPHYSHGAAVADYNNDGWPDILVTGYGGLLLFQNRGDGSFTPAAERLGLTDRQWSCSAAWGDLNGDGHLDVYVVHYVNWSWNNNPRCLGLRETQREVCGPKDFNGLTDVLYFGNGDGTFRDGGQQFGLKSGGKGLGVIISDLDADRRLDVYVTNDGEPNFLYRNLGDGRAEEVGLGSGTSRGDNGRPEGSMGVSLGDFNRDGLFDLWVVNYERESFGLYRNDGKGLFTHVSQSTGVTALGGRYVGWGTLFADFDRDADEDLFVSNGHVIRHPVNAPLLQKAILLENIDGRRFRNVAAVAGPYFKTPRMGRGVAKGDLDNDGDTDLAVVHTNKPATLLKNESRAMGRWVSLELIGRQSSRTPIGAVLRVETAEGPIVRQLVGGGSHASTSDVRLLIGFGQRKIREAVVLWPSGLEQTISIADNQRWMIIEGQRPLKMP